MPKGKGIGHIHNHRDLQPCRRRGSGAGVAALVCFLTRDKSKRPDEDD
jgi:hypothetical protein